MKYLCLVYGEEQKLDALSMAEADRLTDDSLGYDDVLEKRGHLVLAQALQSVRTATSIRVRDDEVDILDGPFAETKEQLLGFLMINAKDKNDAIEIATKIPLARLGTIEVRPIMKLRED
jgi:hypothetical protein